MINKPYLASCDAVYLSNREHETQCIYTDFDCSYKLCSVEMSSLFRIITLSIRCFSPSQSTSKISEERSLLILVLSRDLTFTRNFKRL